jgi:hypothetical protein
MKEQRFAKIESAIGGIVDEDYREAFGKLGINSIDGVFSFSKGRNLAKKNLASYRSRLRFETDSPKGILFLKRYNRPPLWLQLKNWSAQKNRKSCGRIDFENSLELSKLGINTAKVIAFGEHLGLLFEKRSFCITEQIPDAEAIERKLPDSFQSRNYENRLLQKEFIRKLAQFIKIFHKTGYRHRDLYFSHIFYDDKDHFYLIDLSRVFKPLLLTEYFLIKDIAELYYSAPEKYFSNTDRLRFYFAYAGCKLLSDIDKRFIKKVIRKARRIERHDKKHKSEPFVSG